MFGPVPRTVWRRLIAPDEENRIRLSVRALLVRAPGCTILIDTGFGDRFGDREAAAYGPDPGRGVEAALAEAGFSPEDVDVVVLTHLHTDHAGGAVKERAGTLVPAFPRARYVVSEREWKVACDRSLPRAGAYRTDDFLPLREAGALDLVGDGADLGHGVRVVRTGGHTEGHLAVLMDGGDAPAAYLSDLVPTRHHVRVPYVAAVDLYPVELMERKLEMLNAAARDRWLLVLDHDPENAVGRVAQVAPGRHRFEPCAA